MVAAVFTDELQAPTQQQRWPSPLTQLCSTQFVNAMYCSQTKHMSASKKK